MCEILMSVERAEDIVIHAAQRALSASCHAQRGATAGAVDKNERASPGLSARDDCTNCVMLITPQAEYATHINVVLCGRSTDSKPELTFGQRDVPD